LFLYPASTVFKNLIVYRIGEGWQPAAELLEAQLAKEPFLPCAPTQPFSVGWAAPRGNDHGALIEIVDGHWLLKLQREQRLLPASVVQGRVDQIAAQIEQQTGRKPGKKARKDLKEQAAHELLPQAFTKTSATRIWIAPEQRLLMVDAGSTTRADEAVSLLIQAASGLSLTLVQTAESPAACMAAWLADGVTPEGFAIERECELKGSDEQKPVVRYARHPLDIEEVRQHLISGKMPTRLALSWRERVAFTLTETLAIKKISFLELAFEGKPDAAGDEAFDADMALATGELGRLIPALLEGLGGEHDFAAPGAPAAAAPAPALASEPATADAPPWA
jgi:recombination associated protein RdgC